MAGCVRELGTTLQRLMEARRLAADLVVQFTQAANATNLAVMADSDEGAATYARESQQKTEAVQKEVDALRPILVDLGYSNESRLLDQFATQFTQLRSLDRSILELAIESTNLKAQRLSFRDAQEAATAFGDAIESAASKAPAPDAWHAKALSAGAVAALRQIQVLQAPHIAEADDEAMTRMEAQMKASADEARSALMALTGLVPSARSQIAAASAALDRFIDLNAQITELSRRNSNVRSLALSLGQRRKLTAACEDSLRALRDTLEKREFTATR